MLFSTGLRAMHWSATIAQLAATLVMTVIRAWIRRGLALRPTAHSTPHGYELDWLATRMTGRAEDLWPDSKGNSREQEFWEKFHSESCWKWSIATGRAIGGCTTSTQSNRSNNSDEVARIRERLGQLSKWTGTASNPAVFTANAIEEVMNTLFTSPAYAGERKLTWSMNGRNGDKIRLSVELESNGRWAARPTQIEAVLSLWLYAVQEDEYTRAGSDSHKGAFKDWLRQGNGALRKRCIRLLGPKERLYLRDLRWYVGDGIGTISEVEELTKDDGSGNTVAIDRHRVVGFTDLETKALTTQLGGSVPRIFRMHELNLESKESNSPNLKSQFLAVVSDAISLELLLAQDIFSTFMWAVAEKVERLSGETTIHPTKAQGKGPQWKCFTLENTILSKLARNVQKSGLGSLEDAYHIIIPPLHMNQKLPEVSCIVEYAREASKRYEAIGRWKEAADVCLWLYDTCKSSDDPIATKATVTLSEFSRNVDYTVDLWTDQHRDPGEITTMERIKSSLLKELDNADKVVISFLKRLYEIQCRNKIRYNPDNFEGFANTTPLHQMVLKGPFRISYGVGVPEHLCAKDQVGLTPLHYAAIGNKLHTAEKLLRGGADPNSTDIIGWSPLHYATVLCYEGMVETLLKLGTTAGDPTLKVLSGWTPLHYAAWEGKESICWTLLQKGAQLGIPGRDGLGALHCAAANGHFEIARLFLEYGADVDIHDVSRRTPLHWAVYKGHPDVAKLLMGKGASPTARDDNGRIPLHLGAVAGTLLLETFEHLGVRPADMLTKDTRGLNPLHLAAKAGKEASARLLVLRDGMDLEAKDRGGMAALHMSARANHKVIVQLLLDSGAKIQAKDTSGRTALHRAARNGCDAIIRLLLDRGADIESKDNTGGTALHQAWRSGHEATVRLLLDRGTDIESKDRMGSTVLLRAALEGREATVRLLLDCGADIEARDYDGWTALNNATINKHENTVRLLLNRGANVDAKNNLDCTALHGAATNGHEAAVRLLLDYSASIEARNNNGWTALHQAAISRSEATVRLLLDRGANIKAKDNSGKTAECVATEGGHEVTKRVLVERGAHGLA